MTTTNLVTITNSSPVDIEVRFPYANPTGKLITIPAGSGISLATWEEVPPFLRSNGPEQPQDRILPPWVGIPACLVIVFFLYLFASEFMRSCIRWHEDYRRRNEDQEDEP